MTDLLTRTYMLLADIERAGLTLDDEMPASFDEVKAALGEVVWPSPLMGTDRMAPHQEALGRAAADAVSRSTRPAFTRSGEDEEVVCPNCGNGELLQYVEKIGCSRKDLTWDDDGRLLVGGDSETEGWDESPTDAYLWCLSCATEFALDPESFDFV